MLDDLVYKYERLSNSYSRNSNRLKAAQDAVTGQTAIKDIASGQVSDGANPSLDNYQYDEIGNLKADKKENITLIEWTVYGKVKSITYTDGTIITFFYDATGNRVHKKLVSGATTEHTWYVRDASGNVLTVYEGAGSSELYAEEQVVYGSSRIGERKPHINVANMSGPATAENQLAAADLLTVSASPWLLAVVQYPNQSLLADAAQIQIGQQPFPYRPKFYEHKLGLKEYELSNHLGNVLAVIGDAKTDMGLTSAPVDDQFITGTGSWTPETGISLSNDNGRLKAVCSTCAGSSSGTDRLFSAVTGQEYRVTVTVDLGTTTALVYAHITKASSSTPIKTVTITSSGTYSFTFTANDPSMRLKLGNDPSDGVFAFWADDVYISSASRYSAKVLSAQDYYAYGMIMPERRFNADKYRFGFNGKENDNEVKGLGNSLDFGARIYDPRLGRFLSIDPLTAKFSYLTPYQFASNCPIAGIDLDGLEFYYAADGSFLGQIGECQEVFTADEIKEETIKNPDGTSSVTKTPINPVNLNINHNEFTTIANIVKKEGGNKTEMKYIAFASKNNADESGTTWYKKLMSGFSSVPKKGKVPLSDDDKSTSAKNARSGVISVLKGDTDPTGGASLWDGTDFIAWGLQSPNNTPQNKFEEYSNIEIPSGVLKDYIAANKKMYPSKGGCVTYSGSEFDVPANVFTDPANKDSQGNFSYSTGVNTTKSITATKTAGGSIFWKVSQNKKK